MQTLLNFKNFVDELQISNSRNYKLDILRKYKDNEDIKYYLNFLYNPFIVTGISDKKLNKNVGELIGYMDETLSVKNLLEFVSKNNTGSDAVISSIQKFKNEKLPSDLYQIFDGIITKNLPLGIDSKSINKCIPNLIPTFSVQLANKYFDDPSRVEGKSFTLTTKLDGNRIIAIKKNGDVHFFTRQGKEYEGLVDLYNELKNCKLNNVCFDGELIADRAEGEDSKDQFQKTQKLARTKDGNKHGVRMRVFDIMTAKNFENQSCTIPYISRRGLLDWVFKCINFEYFVLVPMLYCGSDTSVIIPTLNEQITKGEEGIMININDAPYRFDRSWDLVKVKKMKDLDLEVIGYEEGTGNFKGMLGAFIVRYKDGNTVSVGSGFEKEFRQEVWQNPESYIGKIITVQYFEETQNQLGGLSLRFPVFITVRDDKDTPDF